MSNFSVPAARVLAGLYERSGELVFYDEAEVAALPAPITRPFTVIDSLYEELLASPGLAVEARACHLTLRVPDARAAVSLANALAPYGGRLLVAPAWGRRGRDHVGVVVGFPHSSLVARLRGDLTRRDLEHLVVQPGTWVPAVVPDADGAWHALAHATRQDGSHVAIDLLSGADAAALIGQPITVGHDNHGVHRAAFRPSDSMLAMNRRLFLPGGGHVLVLGANGKAVAAPHVHRLTAWDTVDKGGAYTACLRPDIAGFDFDSPTAIRAALTTQVRLGLPPIIVWRSGSEGHLGGVTRVAPTSMADLADAVHEAEAALCVARGLPRPDRMVVRGGQGARMRPPATPTVKPGAQVGAAVGVLRAITDDDEPVIEWVVPDLVPELIGLGERPIAIPPAWLRGDGSMPGDREPSCRELLMPRVSRSREGIVATTATEVIHKWGLSGDPAMALTLPRAELLDRAASRIDTSRWVGSLLWALIVRGADEDECVAAVEACEGLALGYKGALPGTPRFAGRIRWEFARVRRAIDSGRRAGHRSGATPGGSCTEAVAARTAALWASWPGGDAAELVTAAALLGMARDGRRLAHLGVGVRRMGATTGCTPQTAAGRLRDLSEAGRIQLAEEAHFDPESGWRADRYDLTLEGSAPSSSDRPPLGAVLGLQAARICWVRGVTPAALLAMASAIQGGTVTVHEIADHWGLTVRQARAAAARVAATAAGSIATYDAEAGLLSWHAGVDLSGIARATGAARRYAKAVVAAEEQRSRLKPTRSVAADESPVVAALPDRAAPVVTLESSSRSATLAAAA